MRQHNCRIALADVQEDEEQEERDTRDDIWVDERYVVEEGDGLARLAAHVVDADGGKSTEKRGKHRGDQRDDEGNRTLKTWPKGIGKRCEKMAALYIGSNDLGVVDDIIEPHILLFEIKDNPNISIDVSNVCPYIKMGYYELVYDSTQNITGCDALNLD